MKEILMSWGVPELLVDMVFTVLVIVAAFMFIMNNVRILQFLAKLLNGVAKLFSKKFGRSIKSWNTTMMRSAYLNKDTFQYTYVKAMEDLIMNLELHKDGVTVMGMTLFLFGSTLFLTLLLNSIVSFGAVLPLAYGGIFAVIYIIFRLVSLTRLERREEMIMDAIDFLVSDIKGGVFNALMRYEESFNPAIRPYFSECIDDIKNKGASFEEAILKLNAALGSTFTDFAYKAIIYEAKADDGLENLFSSIIETNRNRRDLRYINNMAFNSLRLEFLISVGATMLYAMAYLGRDDFVFEFLTQTFFGRLMIIIDILIVAAVMAFITEIKAKAL